MTPPVTSLALLGTAGLTAAAVTLELDPQTLLTVVLALVALLFGGDKVRALMANRDIARLLGHDEHVSPLALKASTPEGKQYASLTRKLDMVLERQDSASDRHRELDAKLDVVGDAVGELRNDVESLADEVGELRNENRAQADQLRQHSAQVKRLEGLIMQHGIDIPKD